MGLFQNRPEEKEQQWMLPAEPFEHDTADLLGEVPSADSLDLNFSNPVTSIVFPVAPVPPAAEGIESTEPGE